MDCTSIERAFVSELRSPLRSFLFTERERVRGGRDGELGTSSSRARLALQSAQQQQPYSKALARQPVDSRTPSSSLRTDPPRASPSVALCSTSWKKNVCVEHATTPSDPRAYLGPCNVFTRVGGGNNETGTEKMKNETAGVGCGGSEKNPYH